jgi:putative flippase GtrA
MSIIIYFVIGGVSFLANFCVFLLFVNIAGQHWVTGNIAGFVAGTLINYLLSVRFVFESRIFFRRQFEVLLTVIVSALGVAMETLLIYFAHEVASLNLNIAKLGAAGVVFFWNYGARRFLVFGATKRYGYGERTGAAVAAPGTDSKEGVGRTDRDVRQESQEPSEL